MISAWDAVGLDRRRMAVVSVVVGIAAGLCVFAATFFILGDTAALLAAAVGAMAGYLVAGSPKRSLDRSAITQAREAPVLAASAAVYLQSTGSRAKTLLMLHSDEPRLAELLENAKRSTLRGIDAKTALGDAGAVRADSVSSIISSVERAQGEGLHDEGQELEGIVRASLSSEETKFPVFLTVCFFLPIMLMLVAAIGHHDDPTSIVSLAFLEVVVLDLALSFSSTERRRLSP
jgi:hypothetical protein